MRKQSFCMTLWRAEALAQEILATYAQAGNTYVHSPALTSPQQAFQI